MAKISELNLYDLDDLVNIWNSGWQELAKFCSKLGFRRDKDTFDGDPKSLNRLIWDSAIEVFEKLTERDGAGLYYLKEFNLLFELAWVSKKHKTPPKGRKYWNADAHRELIIKQNSVGFRKTLNMVLSSLCQCTTLGEVVKTLANEKLYMIFRKDFKSGQIRQYEKIEIADNWKSAFSWLRRALSSEITEEEGWWNCAWLFTKSQMSDLLEIRKQISVDKPLTDEDFNCLNWHISYGYPRVSWIVENDGKKTYEVVLEADDFINLYPLTRVAVTALIQPAFKIAQELQNTCSKPRFIKQCRAPSCGKLFYTGRENATACPAKNSTSKSSCALEWIRYKRYLQKIGKSPEKHWHNQQLKKQFIAY